MSGLVASVLVLARGVAKEMPTKYEATQEDLASARGMTVEAMIEKGDEDNHDEGDEEMDEAEPLRAPSSVHRPRLPALAIKRNPSSVLPSTRL